MEVVGQGRRENGPKADGLSTATYKLVTGPSSSAHAQLGPGTRCPQGWEPLCRTRPVRPHMPVLTGQNPRVGAPDRPPSLEEEVKGDSLQCPAQQLQEPPTLPGGLGGHINQ